MNEKCKAFWCDLRFRFFRNLKVRRFLYWFKESLRSYKFTWRALLRFAKWIWKETSRPWNRYNSNYRTVHLYNLSTEKAWSFWHFTWNGIWCHKQIFEILIWHFKKNSGKNHSRWRRRFEKWAWRKICSDSSQ